MNNDDDNAQENAGGGAQENGVGNQANAGGGAQANGVPGAQENGVAGGGGHGGGGGGLPPNLPIHPIPDPNDGGPQANGLVGHVHDDVDVDEDFEANAEIQANVNNGLAGLNEALQILDQGTHRIHQGVNLLEFEPVEAEAVLLNRPETVMAMRACLAIMQQAAVRIQGSINDIVGRFEFDETQIFPDEIRQISVTARLASSSALAIHGFLVYNADCHVDNAGAHGTIQDGLGEVHNALALFQLHVARFLGYEAQQGFVWEE